jgi:hypothetical protein
LDSGRESAEFGNRRHRHGLFVIGGTATQGDVIQVVFDTQAGSRTLSYTAPAAPSLAGNAAALAAILDFDPVLASVGVNVTVAGAVITITYPSYLQPQSPSSAPPSNQINLTAAVTGVETATVASGTNGSTIGNAITALGLTAITTFARWLTARCTVLTGAGANISVTWHGAA